MPSDPGPIMPTFTVPDPPHTVSIVNLGDEADINWIPPVNNGGSEITEYKVEIQDKYGNFV